MLETHTANGFLFNQPTPPAVEGVALAQVAAETPANAGETAPANDPEQMSANVVEFPDTEKAEQVRELVSRLKARTEFNSSR